jgi:hypothetical protein
VRCREILLFVSNDIRTKPSSGSRASLLNDSSALSFYCLVLDQPEAQSLSLGQKWVILRDCGMEEMVGCKMGQDMEVGRTKTFCQVSS